MTTHKAMVLREFGITNVLWQDVPTRAPGLREVKLAMRAFSLNYRDQATVSGRAPGVKLPLIPLSDGVGEVIECGADVTRFKLGERVCPMFLPRWISGKAEQGVYGQSLGGTVDGVLAEYVTLSEDAAARVPAHLSDVQAATLPCAALTAWTALTSDGGIHAGDTVVLQGTGGVSIAGLQLAKAMGAETIITSSDDAKLERARALGATHCINYRQTPKWSAKVMELTQGRGADRVLDVGGADTLPKAIDCLAQNGRVAIIGVLSGYDTPFNIGPVMMRHSTIEGITVGSRSGFEAMCRAIRVNRIEPVVDAVYKVSQFGEAIEALIAAKHFGKIALTF